MKQTLVLENRCFFFSGGGGANVESVARRGMQGSSEGVLGASSLQSHTVLESSHAR